MTAQLWILAAGAGFTDQLGTDHAGGQNILGPLQLLAMIIVIFVSVVIAW